MLALCGHMKGEFKENKFHGEGTYKWDDGATYKGMWRENKMHGKGCYIDPEEVKWEGQFYNVSSAPASACASASAVPPPVLTFPVCLQGKFNNGRAFVSLR